MITNNPEVQAILVTCTDRDGETILSRGVRLIENHDPSCMNVNWNYEPLVRLSDYQKLQAECDQLRKDAERYRWIRLQVGVQLTGSKIYPASPYLLTSPPAPESLAESTDFAIDTAMQEANNVR